MCHGLPFQDDWGIRNWDSVTGMYAFDCHLPASMPTALVCRYDMAAYYVIEALARQGLHCPEDVSVIRFDNTRLATSVTPHLTTVNISTKDLAITAIERLLRRISEPNLPLERLYIKTALIERESVRALPTDL